MFRYSKKVMQHFLKPRNVGELKDADGIGKVGNPVCLLPQEKIHKNTKNINISNVKKTQKILTHTGVHRKIKETSSKEYEGEIVLLKNNLGRIKLTPEHLIYATKKPSKSNYYMRIQNKKKLLSSWNHARDLERGDIILYPILKDMKDIKELEIDIPKLRWDYRSKELPKKIPLNPNLLRLFGYFLAEGNIQDKPSKTYISFTLNYKENIIMEDIKRICKELFDIDVKITKRPKRNTVHVFLYNAQLARWFKKLFGNGAARKKIPHFIMILPKEKQKALIQALWRGDGYINLKRNGPRAGYSTISYQLAQQIKILLLRQKIALSIYKENKRVSKWANHKKAYRIHVGQRDSLIRLCKILNIDYKPTSYESITSWFDENYFYTPITEIKRKKYKGQVNNLEIEKDHSFTSEAFCLHNCGDVMWVYIKVGKKKSGKNKGKEIIKDIRFKTLGCAAAIATSSMITELAKGKTLEKAKKITRDDVALALKGLPPIKMHCSNLAAQALHKAIQNYEKKKKK